MRGLAFLSVAVACTGFVFAGEPARAHDFAHIGDGAGIRTVLLISNPNDEEATATFKLIADNGSPLELEVNGTTNTQFEVVIPAQGSARLVTAGSGNDVVTGWAQLRSKHPLGALILFEIRSGGKLVTQAVVGSSLPLQFFQTFVEQTDDSNTGLAIANLSLLDSITVVLRLLNSAGAEIAKRELTVEANQHLAQFIRELFAGVENVSGVLVVESTGPMAVTTLQQTGLVIGTLPPIALF